MTSVFDRIGPVHAFREIRRDFDRVVLVLATGDLVASFGFALVFPFLSIYLVQRLGATATEAGLVIAAYSVCSIVSGAAGGWLADRVGRRRVMIVSVGTTGVVVALMGQAGNLAAIGALTLLLGIVDPAFVPAARAAIADVVPEDRRARAYGLLNVAFAVGWIAGPAAGAGLATLGYNVLFAVSGLLIGAYAIIAFIWLPETLPSKRRDSALATGPASAAAGSRRPDETGAEAPVIVGATPAAVTARASVPPSDPPRAGSGDELGLVRARARAFLTFLPIAVVLHATIFLWVTVLPIHASRDLAVPTGAWGILFSLNGLIIVLFQLRISTAVESRPKALVMAAATVAYAAGMAVVAVLGPPELVLPGLALAIVLFTTGEILLFPMEPAFVSDLSPVDRRGRYQGFFLAATGLGTAIGPPLGGFVIDAVPGSFLWLASALAFLACGGAFTLLARRTATLPPVDAA